MLPIGATINGVTIVDDATRVPLYTHTPGFVSLSLGAGVTITNRVSVSFMLTNLLDQSYRTHGSGVDAPGRGGYVRVNMSY